jgi:hypothetical protein
LLTLDVAEWNFAACASAPAVKAMDVTSATVATTIHRRDLLIELLSLEGHARAVPKAPLRRDQ